MIKVEGQQVERRRRENRGAEDRDVEGAEGMGIFNFLSLYAAFWVQSDAFSDITRPVSQPAESSGIIKAASATLDKGCRAF